VRTTLLLPGVYTAEQVEPQLILLSALVMVPPAVGEGTTVMVTGPAKVAVTVTAAVAGTVQVPVPVQPPPDQPVNKEFVPAAAVRTTLLP